MEGGGGIACVGCVNRLQAAGRRVLGVGQCCPPGRTPSDSAVCLPAWLLLLAARLLVCVSPFPLSLSLLITSFRKRERERESARERKIAGQRKRRGGTLPVCKACGPDAGSRARGAGWGVPPCRGPSDSCCLPASLSACLLPLFDCLPDFLSPLSFAVKGSRTSPIFGQHPKTIL